jgi:hypothetical protein|tara:strand:- start:221 stop:355 length:135 start_codon:yes stop_codon:yes gene_type:complete
MKNLIKILISITITPIAIILLIGIITIAIHEALWKSKEGNLEVK